MKVFVKQPNSGKFCYTGIPFFHHGCCYHLWEGLGSTQHTIQGEKTRWDCCGCGILVSDTSEWSRLEGVFLVLVVFLWFEPCRNAEQELIMFYYLLIFIPFGCLGRWCWGFGKDLQKHSIYGFLWVSGKVQIEGKQSCNRIWRLHDLTLKYQLLTVQKPSPTWGQDIHVSFLGAFFHKFHGTKRVSWSLIHRLRRDPLCFVGPFSLFCLWFGHGDPGSLSVSVVCCKLQGGRNYQQYIRQTHLPCNLTFLGWLKLTLSKVKWPETRGYKGHRLHGPGSKYHLQGSSTAFSGARQAGPREGPSAFWVLPLGDAYFDVKWRKQVDFPLVPLNWSWTGTPFNSFIFFFDVFWSLPFVYLSLTSCLLCSTAKSASSAWIYHSCHRCTAAGLLTILILVSCSLMLMFCESFSCICEFYISMFTSAG